MYKLLSVFAITLLATPALAQSKIEIESAFATASSPVAQAGAAYMAIVNRGDVDDRLIEISTDAAVRAELHTHIEDANGVARMVRVEDGLILPAGGKAILERGADHVMLMGLQEPFADGETVTLTLTFEQGGVVTLDVPINMSPRAGHGAHQGHGEGHTGS